MSAPVVPRSDWRRGEVEIVEDRVARGKDAHRGECRGVGKQRIQFAQGG
ncbi:MAG: hypothetical protein M5U33_07165 [Pseudorhodoplanes sp.]|nr:hypothetical protein [Pseudorhodoplanes sp.]